MFVNQLDYWNKNSMYLLLVCNFHFYLQNSKYVLSNLCALNIMKVANFPRLWSNLEELSKNYSRNLMQ